MLGNAGVGVGSVLLFTVSWKVLLITLISGCLLDRLLAVLSRARVPPFFGQFAGAAMMTLIAAGVYAAGRLGVKVLAGVDPTVIVVGGIVMLVAGMTIVGAMQDAIDQFYVDRISAGTRGRAADGGNRGRHRRRAADRAYARSAGRDLTEIQSSLADWCAVPRRRCDLCKFRGVGLRRLGHHCPRYRHRPAGLGRIHGDGRGRGRRGTGERGRGAARRPSLPPC